MQTSSAEAEDPFLDAKHSAALAGISVPSFWRGVAEERFPQPAYPASKAPRWRRSWLLKALEESRQMPRDAMIQRRQRSLERRRGEAKDLPPAA